MHRIDVVDNGFIVIVHIFSSSNNYCSLFNISFYTFFVDLDVHLKRTCLANKLISCLVTQSMTW